MARSSQNPWWLSVLDWMCHQQGSLYLQAHIIKICPQPVRGMTTWTLDNFLRWFRICNQLESEEMSLTTEKWDSGQPTESTFHVQLAPPSKFVHDLSKEWLHGLCTTFYADSESMTCSKVKKFTWIHVLCWEPMRSTGLWATVHPQPNSTLSFETSYLNVPT